MIAKYENDRSVSTIQHSVFNFDREARDFLDPAECRTMLDFKIVKRQSYDANGRKLAGQFHLVNETSDTLIPAFAVGPQFAPVQHIDAYDMIVNDIMPQVPGMKLETVGTLHGTGTGLVIANLGDDYHFPGDESDHRTRLVFSNPVGHGSLILGFTSVRVICENTLAMAQREVRHSKDGYRMRHTSNAAFYCKNAIKAIEAQITGVRRLRDRIQYLAEEEIGEREVRKALDRVYPTEVWGGNAEMSERLRAMNQNRRDAVMAQFDTDKTFTANTGWKLFNAFTYPIFHPKSYGTTKDDQSIAYGGMMGTLGERVSDIFGKIESIVAAA